MTTSEKPSEEDVEYVRKMIKMVQFRADRGDPVAELTVSVLEYAQLINSQVATLRGLVLTQNAALKLLLEGTDTKIALPEAPDNLPGYG